MLLRQLEISSLRCRLSNIMACPSSAEPNSLEPGLDEFYRLGGNCIHLHGEGGGSHSRQATGNWLRRHRLRSKFFLCVQIAHDGWDPATGRAIGRFTPQAVAEDITSNLNLLGTDYLDFVYLADNPGAPVERVIGALTDAVASGRIRAFGARNWTAERIMAANAHAVGIDAPGIAAVVTTELALLFSTRPLWPQDIPFSQLEPTVLDLGLAVFAHADTFNQGLHLFDEGQVPAQTRWMHRWSHAANPRLVAVLREVACGRGLTPMEVNLAWLLNRSFPTVALIGLPYLLAGGGARFARASQMLLDDAELSVLRPFQC